MQNGISYAACLYLYNVILVMSVLHQVFFLLWQGKTKKGSPSCPTGNTSDQKSASSVAYITNMLK